MRPRTLVVLEEAGTEIVDLAGLDQVELGAIDLSYAKDKRAHDHRAGPGRDHQWRQRAEGAGQFRRHGHHFGGAERGGSERIDGVDYDIYSLGDDGTVYVEQGVSVVY